MKIDNINKEIIRLTQSGLPLVNRPYLEIATQLNISEQEVLYRFNSMLNSGIIRRIAAVPNHYKIGYTANGMSVWDIPSDKIDFYGEKIGQLDFVSHCYQRPRHKGIWNYNLFAMLHAHSREEVIELSKEIINILGDNNLGHEILFSKQILKKTGLRIK